MPLKQFENQFYSKKVKLIAGADEAGRGPLAGPVVAACVVFNKNVFIEGINDSKKLSAKKRELLFDEIISKALDYHIEIIDVNKIEEINILQASLLGMKNSFMALKPKIDLLLVDGNKIFPCETEARSIIKGDGKSFSIAAASILAKVTRDRLMIDLAEKFPNYKWEKNKGYGTKEHIKAIKNFGGTKHHRRKFLRNILEDNWTIVE